MILNYEKYSIKINKNVIDVFRDSNTDILKENLKFSFLGVNITIGKLIKKTNDLSDFVLSNKKICFERYELIDISLKDMSDEHKTCLDIHLNKKCNMKCFYCYPREEKEEFLPLDNFEEKLKEFKNKRINIALLGGEITLISNLKEYIDILKKYKNFKNKHLFTNALIFSEELSEYSKKNGEVFVDISFDTIVEGHSSRGSTNVILKNIKKYVDSGSNVIINSTLDMISLMSYEETVEELYKIGVRKFKIKWERREGTYLHYNEKTSKVIKIIQGIIDRLSIKYSDIVFINTGEYIPKFTMYSKVKNNGFVLCINDFFNESQIVRNTTYKIKSNRKCEFYE